MDTVDITLYLVGETEEDARERMPFDSEDSAKAAAEYKGGEVYEVTATIDFSTIRKTI